MNALNYRSGYFDRGQPTGLAAREVYLNEPDLVVIADAISCILIRSDETDATLRTFTLKSSTLFGQILTLIMISDGGTTCQLVNGGNTSLSSTWAPVLNDCITLVWNGLLWIEYSRGLSGSASYVSSLLPTGQIIVGNISNIASPVDMTGATTIDEDGVTTIQPDVVDESMLVRTTTDGMFPKRFAKAIFDSAVSGVIGTYALPNITIPANSLVTGVWVWVTTTFESLTDAATIAIQCEAPDDIVPATMISDLSDPWDATARPFVTIVDPQTPSSWLYTTLDRTIDIVVGSEDLTAGRMFIIVDYMTME